MGGWTRTGDIGYLDDDGYLYLTDRLKDVIIKGGMNISTVEVENALREHPLVTDCAIFGIPTNPTARRWPRRSFQIIRFSLEDIRGFLSAELSVHKIPKKLLRLTELPRNRSGKVLKNDLRARYPARQETKACSASVRAAATDRTGYLVSNRPNSACAASTASAWVTIRPDAAAHWRRYVAASSAVA